LPRDSLRPGSLAFNPDTPRCLSTPLLTPFNSTQFAEATARVAAAGVADRVTIVLKDYRDHLGADERATYDKVISIEMIEAVGHEHLPGFFRVVSDALKPGGKAAIQVRSIHWSPYDPVGVVNADP
jgi:cyclopropane fatty-acyl-phospholipid synthase-like methyltransferase